MKKIIISFSFTISLFVLAGGLITYSSNISAQAVPQYTVENGKVDKRTFNGYRRYHGICHTCHGPDALGSTIGPSLVDSLQTLTYAEFKDTVLNGRTTINAQGQASVMTPFKDNADIVKYLDDIYMYVKARSDGVIGPGRPQKIK